MGWACDPDWLAEANDRVEQLMGTDRLSIVLKESKDKNEAAADSPLYEVDKHGLAHVRVEGPITKYPTSFSSLFGGTSTVLTERALREIAQDEDVKAIAMHYDTPGGTIAGLAKLAETIRAVAAVKPVHGVINGQCCSAGLWLASQSTTLTAEPTNEVGSLGGMVILTDTSDNLQRQGVRRVIVKNKAAEFKGIAAPGVKVTDKDIQEIESRLEDQVQYFTTAVKTGRKLSDENLQEVAKARVYEAAAAQKLGLIDKVIFADDRITEIHSEIARDVKRDQPSQTTTPPVAPRSATMFNAEQLQRIKKLPGAEAATEATAGDMLLQVAESLAKRPERLPDPPAKPSEEAVSVKLEKIDLLVERQHMTKAQGDALAKSLKEAPEGFFAAIPTGGKVIDTVIKTFELSKTPNNPSARTTHQPEPVQTQASDEQDDEEQSDEAKLAEAGRKQGKIAKEQALAARGIA